VTLRQYTPAFSLHDSDGHTSVIDQFDALVCDQALIRVYRSAADTLTVDRLQSEDSGDHSWSTQNLVATSISATVPPSLYAQPRGGDNDVRVFWYDGTNIKYFESLDEGVTWGAAQQVGVVANVTFLAATDLERVHYTTTTTRGNTRFHVYHENGGWSVTSSEIYWPYVPSSFDAVPGNQLDDGANWENDIIAFTTFFPPIVGLKVMGTEVYNTLTEVQGIAFIRYQNGRWSDHWTFDVVDKAPAFPSRYGIKLFVSSMGWIFLCYERYDGTENYGHYATAISRSKTGLEWELPYLLTRDLDEPFVLLVNGNKTYLVNSQYTHRSLTCGYTGTEMVTQDIEDNVVSLNIQTGDIAQLTMRVANPEQELDATTPFSNDAVLDAVIKLGYKVGGEDLKIQTLLADIDTIDGEVALPTDHVTITGRDYLARLLTVQADQPNEWESQAIGGDSFQSGEDATDYSGLRHTAVQEGFFTAPNGTNSLALAASEAPGVAFSTLARDAWNGSIQSGVYVQADDYEDWVGLVFRAHDKKNHLSIRYSIKTDSIGLVDRRDNVDEILYAETSVGWVKATWYYIKVRFRYGYVWVYTSTDGVEWTEAFTWELDGASSTPTWTWASWAAGTVPTLSGRMGYIGYGFSEYDEGDGYNYDDFPPLPDPIPIEPIPVSTFTGRKIISTDKGVFVTDEIGDTPPVWYAVNDGLTAADLVMTDIKRDPFHWWNSEGLERTLWGFSQSSGIWKLENFPNGTWTQVVTPAALLVGITGTTGPFWGRLDFSIEVDGRYAAAARYGWSGHSANVIYAAHTIQDGVVQSVSWIAGAVNPAGVATWNDIKFGQHSAGQTLVWCHSYSGGTGTTRLWRTLNFGTAWTQVLGENWGTYLSLSVPYVSVGNPDTYGFYNHGAEAYTSVDGLATWQLQSWASGWRMGTGGDHTKIFVVATLPKYSTDGGASWTELPAHGFGYVVASLAEWGEAGPESVLLGDENACAVALWEPGMVAYVDKTGNLGDFGITAIYQIDRDTMNGEA